jgi:hypothetical protein
METPSFSSLESLANLGSRSGIDMRPTLLRVLTDLYMQKLSHTPDEDRHYTELALRLLDAVDVATRAAVATRLARHLSPPIRVLQYLVNDLPEIATPLRSHPLLQPSNPAGETPNPPVLPSVDEPDDAKLEHEMGANAPHVVDATTANELNELFFGANAEERSLILRNLDLVAPLPSGHAGVSRNPDVGQRLEAAALSRNRGDFALHLANSLHIPREQARRIASDSLGEPIVVAAKALSIRRDLVYRILMFVNPAVGHSVERVHALAMLYDELTAQAADGMIAIWQSLPRQEHVAAQHRPLLRSDETRSRARPATAVRRSPTAPPARDRRDAS